MDDPVLSGDPTGAPVPRHEFGTEENDVIGSAARWVTWWGWIAMGAGLLLIAGGVATLGEGGLTEILLGAVYLLVGVYFRGAGRSLGNVVETTGQDVAHLMRALERLTSAFRVQVILVLVALAMIVIAGITVAVTSP